MKSLSKEESIVGCLIGGAVGDALGLICEGLTPRRQQRLYGDITRYSFIFGKGMVSDDTEHTCMAAQALLASGGDVSLFEKDFARRLRFWLLGCPAGIGQAVVNLYVVRWIEYGTFTRLRSFQPECRGCRDRLYPTASLVEHPLK